MISRKPMTHEPESSALSAAKDVEDCEQAGGRLRMALHESNPPLPRLKP
jgi:hypothetical protein